MPTDVKNLTERLKAEARRLGFALAGVCPAVTPEGLDRFAQWLAAGYAGDMAYLESRAEAYEHPRHVLDGARSLLVLATTYRTVEPGAPQAGQGRVSRYAWGNEYHDVIRARLNRLAQALSSWVPGAHARGVVDTAPLSEREFAQLAGLGWVGKNSLLLNRELGSWFFLSVLLTDIELAYDDPHATDHCGTCRACLDACPTDAFVDAYVLDARKCISYLTIEARGPMPVALRAGVGDWLFGCDVCQDVCPWNQRVGPTDDPEFQPREARTSLDLCELFSLDDAAFRARFRDTPLWRAKRRGLLRNAAVVLGNTRPPEGLAVLVRALDDLEPLVRGAVAWALGHYGSLAAKEALARRFELEPDAAVRAELAAAIASHGTLSTA